MKYEKIIENLKKDEDKIISRNEICDIYCKQYNRNNSRTIDNVITYLKSNNIINEIGKDLFYFPNKEQYSYRMSKQEEKIYDSIKENYPDINYIVWRTECLRDFMRHFPTQKFIIVETEKIANDSVISLIKERYSNKYTVITEKMFIDNMELFSNDDVIIVKTLNSKSPIKNINNRKIITVEKILVDIYYDSMYIMFQGQELKTIYENVFDRYSINFKALLNYSKYRSADTAYTEFLKKVNLPSIYMSIINKNGEIESDDVGEYEILQYKKDFIFTNEINNKGSREKRTVIDTNKMKKAMFKYQLYECSESCSEKVSYEIANVLDYECAEIEFAKDENGVLGILNYFFSDKNKNQTHMDIISYINRNNVSREEFYTVDNIKKCLDKIDKKLFGGFIRIMVFDALVGEQDRHEENWGLTCIDGKYKISPLYDNGCSLLREFYNEENAQRYYSGERSFEAFINRSKTYICKDSRRKYKHFELIKELYTEYTTIVTKEINNLKKLTDDKINSIINKIPKDIITEKHKEYMIKYVKIRRDILLSIIEEGNE